MPARKQIKRKPAKPVRKTLKKRPLAAEDLLSIKFVHGGSIAPDGSSYVFPVRTARKDRKGYNSHLYIVKTEDGTMRQFTFGKRSDGAPVYSPDGATIAFVGMRGHYPGIHLIPVDGGEARTLVEKDGSFDSLSFSPDGKTILCAFRPNDPLEGADGKKKDKSAESDPEAPPPKREAPTHRHITRLFYRLDGAGFLPKTENQIWIFDIETGKGTQLTQGKRGANHPVFSPDGKRIAFVSNIRPDPDVEQDLIDLFVMPAKGGKPRLIPTPPGISTNPSFSPDGTKIAYLGHDDPKDPWFENTRVWVVPANGRGDAKCLCRKFDQPAYDGTISDMGGGFFEMKPQWSPTGGSIYFISCGFGSSGLYKVSSRGGTPVQITPDKIHLQSVALSENRRTAIGVVSSATMPAEVYAFDVASGEGKRLTFLTKDWAAEIDIQKPQYVRIKSTENTRVDAWILKPPKFSPRKKYPAIVEVHGGPMTQYGYSFFHELQLLAAKGYVVFYSNPRGSLGYGRGFSEAIKNNWGGRDFEDVMAGTDYLESLPYVNPKRIGITGGSYGGFMTNWAVGQTHRYKAAVTQRSVVDMIPFFGSSDVGFSFHHELGGHPWENVEGYRKQSPLTYAKNIKTPLLIIHSENDMRCNIEQAENLFATLKVLKRKTEFIRFPEEPHGLSRGGRPDRRIIRLEKILDWFERYL
ncbi:MAG: S9 family peptidase [Candidatus Eisenbacteria bacterium]|uniref:S9 family peptidase n=1 Tax=Eiseniibacteriota bacterium TaxID=2212470 RepID=A0A948W378_UNCEI|nr:S9 family peptidase [Candidatus Eisenbacteria bacterium]MBU1949133.1 S9 family peptidase [Candidatus Eisenbacteria bacterium]MBU2690787.1 S9 family peptidase [Candidatus Eisenbacteria bacterium]